ncbi:cell division protein ZapC [Oceanisphaera litoralis]|uniref:cell division protein ZapC domain-containing protein n=1 Tax=Oceanisphaera litoralis TaxID=225144 RepID=UPI00195CDF5F|nr:cell division protein ZapC domain-containing protein [Oceanisphaera litoralis]MBM7454700.1 cell division protein ZapC [Oceanisphaera litoralis]
MLLQPNDGWRWFMGEDRHLMLDLGVEMQFSTPYIKKQLVCSDNMEQCFSVEDTGLYYRFLDQLSSIRAPAQRVQAALNGIAIARFYKPLMPQSWFFEPQADYHQPDLGELIALDIQTEQLTMMVVETSPSATVCMSLSAGQLLAETKQLPTFGAIKVMNDRIISLEVSYREEEIRKVG